MKLSEIEPFVDEIEEKLPGWWWSLHVDARSIRVGIGADQDGPYASIRKEGVSAMRAGTGFDNPGEAAALFRLAIDAALREKARCDSEVATASIHLLTYERRKRIES